MIDIPEDVMVAAKKHFGAHEDPYCDIARAILAERERCAKIAESWSRRDEDDFLEPDAATGRNVAAKQIGRAIRSGVEEQR